MVVGATQHKYIHYHLIIVVVKAEAVFLAFVVVVSGVAFVKEAEEIGAAAVAAATVAKVALFISLI